MSCKILQAKLRHREEKAYRQEQMLFPELLQRGKKQQEVFVRESIVIYRTTGSRIVGRTGRSRYEVDRGNWLTLESWLWSCSFNASGQMSNWVFCSEISSASLSILTLSASNMAFSYSTAANVVTFVNVRHTEQTNTNTMDKERDGESARLG